MSPEINQKRIVILGASGGLGSAFLDHFLRYDSAVHIDATYFQSSPENDSPIVQWHALDVTDESSVRQFCDSLGEVDLCINAVGMLHDSKYRPEKSTSQISSDYFMNSMRINALPTLLLARYIAPRMKHKRNAVFATVSARVGSIEENYLGGWYSYRASKAALNMILKTLSIEWQRCLPNVAVAALHPGTTDTRLSQPFQKNIKHELFKPQQSVSYMMEIIMKLRPEDSGKFWSFDGEILPW